MGVLSDAAASGDRRQALEALRARLAAEIESCESKRDMASLSLRFMDVVAQIAEIDAEQPATGPKETGLSEFERRLRERESAAQASRRTTG